MIHQYKLGGYHIVLDIGSGSVHSVDEVAYELISLYGKLPEEALVRELLERFPDRKDVTEAEVRECLADVKVLETEGKLFAQDHWEELAAADTNREDVVKALCLHVAHSCNLRCAYCFAGQGNYQGEQALMPYETGREALDFLISHSGTRRNLEVDFFGGEPLLNWEVVKRLVAYARSREAETGKRFRFTLTTNGLLIDDEVIDFANREMGNVVLSLDGRRETHDRLRKTVSGGGSYDLILPKFKKLVEARGGRDYYMRGTYTHENPDFAQDVFHMADLGYTELSMEPVVCAPSDPWALTEEDFPILCRQYELLAEEMLRRRREGRGFRFYHYLLDLEGGPCIYKRLHGCGSGSEYLAVTPQGDLYPCHQFVGEESWRMGSVREGVTRTDLRDKFKNTGLYTRPACRDCWARLYCAGGCAANACHAAGSIEGVYEYGCRLFKKRLECAIMLQVAESEEGL
jgi:uncharacterized protein